jgi:hypothetical protein
MTKEEDIALDALDALALLAHEYSNVAYHLGIDPTKQLAYTRALRLLGAGVVTTPESRVSGPPRDEADPVATPPATDASTHPTGVHPLPPQPSSARGEGTPSKLEFTGRPHVADRSGDGCEVCGLLLRGLEDPRWWSAVWHWPCPGEPPATSGSGGNTPAFERRYGPSRRSR